MSENQKSVKDVLVAARAKIAAGWVKGHYALDSNNKVTLYSDSKACQFCTEGAFLSFEGNDTVSLIADAMSVFMTVNGIDSIPIWNDFSKRTHEEVLAAFDKAIAIAS